LDQKQRTQAVKDLVIKRGVETFLPGANHLFPPCKDPLRKCGFCGEDSEYDWAAANICICKPCFETLKRDW
jgi:hypothetical protein